MDRSSALGCGPDTGQYGKGNFDYRSAAPRSFPAHGTEMEGLTQMTNEGRLRKEQAAAAAELPDQWTVCYPLTHRVIAGFLNL